MARECLNCGGVMQLATKDVPFEYKGRESGVPKVTGWHCQSCHEVEFAKKGDGDRFAKAVDQFASEIDAQVAADLARIRKKLKLTQGEAARITGGGPNAFSRYERGKARPLPAVTNLFKILDRHPELLRELER